MQLAGLDIVRKRCLNALGLSFFFFISFGLVVSGFADNYVFAGQFDYNIGLGTRSLPLGLSSLSQMGYGQVLWGTYKQNSYSYGYIRPYQKIQASGFINRFDSGIGVYPISIFGFEAGHTFSFRNVDLATINCDAIECRGRTQSNYIGSRLILGALGFGFVTTVKQIWIQPENKSRLFGDESSNLIGLAGGDRLFSLDATLIRPVNDRYSVGLYAYREKMLGAQTTSDHESVFGSLTNGDWTFTIGSGAFRSTTSKRGFTAYGAVKWTGKKSVEIF
ncbi:MAG: hypothetical protein AB7F43_11490 [Bacteriovoracia bacterium]